MKYFLAVISMVWFYNEALSVETCDKSTDTSQVQHQFNNIEYDAMKAKDNTDIGEVERWLIDLSYELLNHHNININVMAMSHLNLFFAEQLDPSTKLLVLSPKQKSSILNKAIESPYATTATLLAASAICQETESKGVCDLDAFNEKLIEQDPDNLNVYLKELNQAVMDSDAGLIDIILNRMSQAKYSRSMNPVTKELIAAIDDFMIYHPLDGDVLLNSMNVLTQDYSDLDLDSLVQQNAIQMIYMGGFQLPALRPLYEACEQHQDNLKRCQTIANILVTNSDTNVMTWIGYSLSERMGEIFGDANAVAARQAAKEAFSDYQSCVLQNHALMESPLEMFDPELLRIITQGKHEGTNLELAALYLYKKFAESGKGDVVDPRSCGLRYVEL